MDTTSLPPDDRPPVTGPRRANRGLLWASALAVVVLAIATIVAFTAGDGSDADKEELDPDATQPVDGTLTGSDPTGQALPAVDYETFEGQTVALATEGRPLVINFWASWCVPCVAEMPALQQTYLANSPAVDFVGLQVSEAADFGRDMVERTGVTYPVGRDPRGDVIEALGGRGLPRTVLVAADGTVAAVHNGEISQEELQALIDETLAG
jgi:cytochrome c biogenesis protein CcmG/thiol:disulfide interchange protein DsbE